MLPLSPEFDSDLPLPPDEYLFYLLIALNRHREQRVDKALKAVGVTVSQYRAMRVILRFEPCAVGELADFSIVERTTMTRTVDQLVAMGLVERSEHGADRRQVIIAATPKGREVHDQALAVATRCFAEDLEGISQEDRRHFIRVAQGLVANMTPDADSRERILGLRRPQR